MEAFSQDDIIESSQKTCRGTKRASGRQRKPYSQRKQQLRTLARHRGSAIVCGSQIPESLTQDASLNVSASLFSGKQDLLKCYDDQAKPQSLSQPDANLERDLEQSRKAYEQLKLLTNSRDLFTCPTSKDVGMNTEITEKCDAAIQPTHRNVIILKDSSTQTEFGKPDQMDVGIQLSPNILKPPMKDVDIQVSLQFGMCAFTPTTLSNKCNNVMVQTTKVEKRNVGVQKYHSTRVREMCVQTSLSESNRNIGKRNVCIQQRSSAMLELNREVALVLGIELKCDPTRLQRLLMRVAAKQCSKDEESHDQNSTGDVEFTEEDPYWVNYGYFMNNAVSDDGDNSDSGLGETEPRMSCNIDESVFLGNCFEK